MKEPVGMLLVEDNPADAELAMRVLRRLKVSDRVEVIADGETALARATAARSGGTAARWKPGVVVLDLKLPKVGGLEVLQRLKGDPRTHDLPVVVLSSSREDRDVAESYRRGANSYVVKPIDPDDFDRVLTKLAQYWLTLNQPPA